MKGRVSQLATLSLAVVGPATCAPPGEPDARVASTSGVTVEYVAHAAVVIEAQDGTRVLIDPYNGSKWMGYHFPDSLDVDAVLVTHPHYDHDAAWEVGSEVPVYREPGTHDIGEIRVIGVRGEHSGAARFRARGAEPLNTIWVVDVGGVRLAHVGDNGLPTEQMLADAGPVDVLFTHPFFPVDSVASAWAGNGLKVVVPVHTRLPDLAVPAFRLATADTWLRGKRPVRDVGNRTRYTADALEGRFEYHVFSPSADVTPWAAELAEAWELSASASAEGVDADSALVLHARAAVLGPAAMTLQVRYATALAAAGRADEAIAVLERVVGMDGSGDVEQILRAHAQLGALLVQRGDSEEASSHLDAALMDEWTFAADARDVARQARERDAGR